MERRRVREEEGSEGKGGQPRARGSGSVREGRERALVGMAKSAQPRPSAALAGEVFQLGRYGTAAAQHSTAHVSSRLRTSTPDKLAPAQLRHGTVCSRGDVRNPQRVTYLGAEGG